MTALLMVAALAVLTFALAKQLGLLGDVSMMIALCVVAGLAMLAVHPDLAWVASPRADEGSCSAEGDEALPLVERVGVQEARALLDRADVSFIDARPGSHYVGAHIPGAMSLPASDAEDVLDMQSLPIPPEGEVIAYCEGGSCEQSEYLGLLLRNRAVCRRVRVLEGGWQAWVSAEAPTVSGDSRFGEPPRSSNSTSAIVQPDLEAAG